jgi:hypothetical protein
VVFLKIQEDQQPDVSFYEIIKFTQLLDSDNMEDNDPLPPAPSTAMLGGQAAIVPTNYLYKGKC